MDAITGAELPFVNLGFEVRSNYYVCDKIYLENPDYIAVLKDTNTFDTIIPISLNEHKILGIFDDFILTEKGLFDVEGQFYGQLDEIGRLLNGFSCRKNKLFLTTWDRIVSYDLQIKDVVTCPISRQISKELERLEAVVPNRIFTKCGDFNSFIYNIEWKENVYTLRDDKSPIRGPWIQMISKPMHKYFENNPKGHMERLLLGTGTSHLEIYYQKEDGCVHVYSNQKELSCYSVLKFLTYLETL